MAEADDSASLRRSSSLVAAGIGLSRISGLARDVALAYFLGANAGADAFRAALKIPNFLQNLLGEGVLSASFIPSYARLLDEGRQQDAGRLAGAVLGLLITLTGVLVLVGVLLARPLTAVLASGMTGERFELTVTLVRIMFPGIGLLVVSAWCLGVLNSHRRFFLSYVAPVMWNGGILAVLIGLGASAVLDPAVAAGWGVVLGGALQVAVQVPSVRRCLAGSLRVSRDRDTPGLRQVLRSFGTIVTGRGIVQITALLDLWVASWLAVGAIAAVGYAQTLYLLPIALFGMSVAAAELPALSTMDHRAEERLRGRLELGLARSAFFVTGVTVAYLALAPAIVGLLLGRGEFDRATVLQVSAVLIVYAVGLLPATASRLLQSVLYAADDPRTPARTAVIRVVVALIIAVPLMLSLDRIAVDPSASGAGLFTLADGARFPTLEPVDAALRDGGGNRARLGALGLAVGSAVGAWVEFVLLRRAVARRAVVARLGGGTLGRLLIAAGSTLLVALAVGPAAPAAPLPRLATLGVLLAACYLGACLALRIPEARQLVGHLGRRLRLGGS
ncbi:MAG: murein biosynthesis integral membrane protein MurJ [Nitriliruptoraceae bacterium]|nr:murein biosynthesis integral membrane protein MurJ [Nitriliruptoraceae bacterium]